MTTQHTVESLMDLALKVAERYCDVQKYCSEETVSDYRTFHNGLQSALTEVLAELAEAKAFAETVGKDYVIATNNLVILQSKCDEQAREALNHTGYHEDGCPYSNDCFSTDCDYCVPIVADREKKALALIDAAQGVGVVGETQHLHELNDEWASKLPIGLQLYAIQGDSND